MDTKFIIVAQRQLDEAVAAIESAHSSRVTPAARMLLQALVVEATTTREAEWRSRANIMLEAYGSEAKVGQQLRESLNAILHQAWLDQRGEFITTRDILSAIQKKWCGIFPIC